MIRHIFGCDCTNDYTNPQCIHKKAYRNICKADKIKKREKSSENIQGNKTILPPYADKIRQTSAYKIKEVTETPYYATRFDQVLIVRALTECELHIPPSTDCGNLNNLIIIPCNEGIEKQTVRLIPHEDDDLKLVPEVLYRGQCCHLFKGENYWVNGSTLNGFFGFP